MAHEGPPPGPLAARPANGGAQERFTWPHDTAGDAQSPGPAATTLPRRRSGSGPLLVLRTPRTRTPGRSPAHPSPAPPGSYAIALPAASSAGRGSRPPNPTPNLPHQGRGHSAAELTFQTGSEGAPSPAPAIAPPPAAAGSDAEPGPLSRPLPAPCAPGGGASLSPRPRSPRVNPKG